MGVDQDWEHWFPVNVETVAYLGGLTHLCPPCPASYCLSDTASVSSSSSLHSLQEPPSFSSGEVRLPSSPPPGADLRSFQFNLFYPGRVSSPRPTALPQPRSALPHSTTSCSPGWALVYPGGLVSDLSERVTRWGELTRP